MIKSCASAALAVPLFLFANTAAAFLDPPYLTPEHPTAGDTVSVNIHGGVCDAIGSWPGYQAISQNGIQIRIVLWSITYHDSGLCNLPIGTATIPVGVYPAGSYTLQVNRDYLGFGGDTLTESLGVIPFSVAGNGSLPEPVAAPALDACGLTLLLLGLIGIVSWERKRSASLLADSRSCRSAERAH
jgi:hypothetical protein